MQLLAGMKFWGCKREHLNNHIWLHYAGSPNLGREETTFRFVFIFQKMSTPIYLEVKEKAPLYNKIKQELKLLVSNNRNLKFLRSPIPGKSPSIFLLINNDI